MKIAVAGATGLIGTKLVALAREQGHNVVELSRRSGFDLTAASVVPPLTEALAGVEAVIDVTQGSSFEENDAVAFFEAVARHLGESAQAAGVARTVVLSIVGIERSPEYGYYVGKVAQERAHREASPGVIVVRATQFHEFAAQMIEWYTVDGVAEVMDVEIQPIDSDEVVSALLQAATGEAPHDLQIAGPSPERLLELSRTWAAAHAPDLSVVVGEAPESMARGAMLPHEGDGVVTRGRDWQTWFAAQS